MNLNPLPEHETEFADLRKWTDEVLPTLSPTAETNAFVTQNFRRLHEICGFPPSMLECKEGESTEEMVDRLERGVDQYLARLSG